MSGSIVPLNFQEVKVEFVFSKTRLTVLQGAFLRLKWMRPSQLIHYYEKISLENTWFLIKGQRALLICIEKKGGRQGVNSYSWGALWKETVLYKCTCPNNSSSRFNTISLLKDLTFLSIVTIWLPGRAHSYNKGSILNLLQLRFTPSTGFCPQQ